MQDQTVLPVFIRSQALIVPLANFHSQVITAIPVSIHLLEKIVLNVFHHLLGTRVQNASFHSQELSVTNVLLPLRVIIAPNAFIHLLVMGVTIVCSRMTGMDVLIAYSPTQENLARIVLSHLLATFVLNVKGILWVCCVIIVSLGTKIPRVIALTVRIIGTTIVLRVNITGMDLLVDTVLNIFKAKIVQNVRIIGKENSAMFVLHVSWLPLVTVSFVRYASVVRIVRNVQKGTKAKIVLNQLAQRNKLLILWLTL
mmetsp:Transcript_1627/g.2049  ORF Transcript_1627/g.2049 Transcript_1627/m.2049 type:complete len:255 (+) Transcript_1627:164-928(+)